MKTALLSGITAVMLTGTIVAAAAQPAPPQPEHTTSLADIKAEADRQWDRMDANHDGKLDAADRDARLLERFAALDTNHDGMISKDEFLADARTREARWHDHHGDAGAPPPPPPPGDHPDGPAAEAGAGPHHGRDGHGGMAAMMVVGPALEAAHKAAGPDGTVTRAAFDAAVKTRFDSLDANHDGTLSHAELRAAMTGMRHEGWHHHDGDHGDMMPPPPPPPPPGQ